MKKVLALLLALVLTMSMASCAMADTAEIALITDIGTIDDKSFNQGCWEGIKAYADAANISYQYYQPAAQGTDVYLDEIDKAVNNGAKIIVTPGYLFEEPVYIAQDMYPEVTFILIDGNPHNADYSEYRTEANAVGIIFKEEESGFLAGYAAVKDGYTKLGFMGGMAVPAVIRFGYGFAQGAEYAAKEMGLTDVTLNYHYTGGFAATPEAQALAASWYNSGVEVIFGCGGAVGNSVMAAAEEAGKAVIGVDVDQSNESETVVTSAMKGISEAVASMLEAYYAGTFPAGGALNLGAAEAGVKLPMETSKFKSFAQADYDAIFAKLVTGEIALTKDTTGADADGDGVMDAVTVEQLPLEIVKITVVQ